MEIHARKSAKSPVGPIIAVVSVALVIGGGVVFKLRADSAAALSAKEAEKQAERQRIEQEAKMREESQKKRFEAMIQAKERELQEAKTEEERARIRQDIERARQRPSAAPRTAPPRDVPVTPKPSIRDKKVIKDDPLDGLKL
jgi:hypothetical protein